MYVEKRPAKRLRCPDDDAVDLGVVARLDPLPELAAGLPRDFFRHAVLHHKVDVPVKHLVKADGGDPRPGGVQ
ncbi:MAG TPA: hypothetical protein VGJ42_03655 [Nitrososphaera sp.]